MSSSDKIAVFIDGANLYATAKTLGFDIDYKRLLEEFQSRGTLLRAFLCAAVTNWAMERRRGAGAGGVKTVQWLG